MKTFLSTRLTLPTRLVMVGLLVATAGAFTLTAEAAPFDGPRGAGGGGGGGVGMLGHPHQVDRMLDSVNATPEQRTQIKQITQAAAVDMKALHAAGRALHEQSRVLFTQPNVDARAAESLRQQMSAQHDQASKRSLQLMLDISRVLSPEQRKLLADRIAQRRSMMERHRAERDGLDGRPALR